jgi:hypothetical protein
MAKNPASETYSDEEAEARLRAALQGARAAGHKTMEDVAPKRRESKPARKPKAAKGKA